MSGSELKKRLSEIADCKNRNDVIICVKPFWCDEIFRGSGTATIKILNKETKQFVASKYYMLTIIIQDIYDRERA